jgi:hypothetical protein
MARTVSLAKQFTGYEVGFNLFQFFGSSLFDINIGAKGQEPLQLGVRTALEEATLRLVAAVARVNPAACLDRGHLPAMASGGSAPSRAAPSLAAHDATHANRLPLAGPINAARTGDAGATTVVAIPFEFSSAALPSTEGGLIERVATIAASGRVDIVLLAHETETLDPGKRDALTDQRVAALAAALQARGVRKPLTVVWRADPNMTAVHGSVAGFQDIVRLQLGA